ncbi:ArpA protein [Streptomyces sp. ISL-66]|uniref:HalD/BesD family halogenase n=1 Tax=Streptomyces sp. ISL-66 TaxID=2819186 RepID=UPI001BE760DF|nr:ArpA protein [Streptomyces sp. ISL-66]MBT2472443.1 ArpA protein [Streptomyces sp. ISL-66]
MTLHHAEVVSSVPVADEVNGILQKHLAEIFSGEAADAVKEQFKNEHIVPLRGFCPPELLAALQAEAGGIMDEHGVDRKFTFEITDNSPRQMTTVGQPVIKEHGPLIDALYFSPAVKDLLSDVVGEEVHTCPYEGEHYVISRLGKSGDTHGWHWDDYTYGFILVLHAPDYRDGGFVQAVPHTSWDKQNPDVHGALLKSQVRSYALEAGDAYVVKTDTTMHRVYPIRGESTRTIVNMTWANGADLGRNITHETNDVLFGGTGGSTEASETAVGV